MANEVADMVAQYQALIADPNAQAAEQTHPADVAAARAVPPAEAPVQPDDKPAESPPPTPEPVKEAAQQPQLTEEDAKRIELLTSYEARIREERAHLAAERETMVKRAQEEARKQVAAEFAANTVQSLRAQGYNDKQIEVMLRDGWGHLVGTENLPAEAREQIERQKLELKFQTLQQQVQSQFEAQQKTQVEAEEAQAAYQFLNDSKAEQHRYLKAEFAADPLATTREFLGIAKQLHVSGKLDSFRTKEEVAQHLRKEYNKVVQTRVERIANTHGLKGLVEAPQQKQPTKATPAIKPDDVPAPATKGRERPKSEEDWQRRYLEDYRQLKR